MTRLGRPVQTGWHAIVPPLHMHTRQQFQIRAASALADSKLAPSCSSTNSGAILCTGVATGMSTEVNESGTVCLSDHHWNTTNAGPWSRAQLQTWEHVPAHGIPLHNSSFPRPMQFSRTPATICHDGCSPRCNARQVARQVYPTSLKEEPHGLGGRATPQQ